MDLTFSGEIFHWRGPSPFHFVAVPEAQCRELSDTAQLLSYGWGCIPVRAEIGDTAFTTSLFPKNGGYLVPVKTVVRRAEGLDLGDVVQVRLTVGG